MEVTRETKLQINGYMLNNFKNKGTVGYHYIKRILEHLLQQYKNTGYIDCPRLSKLILETNIDVTYAAVQRAINYFLTLEHIELSFPDFIIDTLEKIIDANQLNLEEEF
jgi:hypothetical protein